MKTPTKNSNSYQIIGSVIISTALLLVFCYIANISLMIPVLLLFLGVHLMFTKGAHVKIFLHMGLLLTLILFTSYIFTEYKIFSPYYIPVATVAMLTILLYSDIQLSFIMAFLSSVIVGLVVGNDLNVMLIFFIGSLTGMYAIKDARTRGVLTRAAIWVALIQTFCVIVLNPFPQFLASKNFLHFYLQPLFINGFLSIGFVIATLKIFEWLFGVVTNFSLLELSDFNHPLLKKMVLEAPGTYHHSLIVSNLSEAAAEAIGAHSLLAKVGAYYHDVGKTIKPEYFTENQMIDGNKHDNLEPSMSRLVILNHVKEGIELAKRYKLDQRIINFIPEHHGTGLIHYFYQRALEDADHDETVDQANFRYAGPKPQSRETAIVLLADSVEGAVRALDDPIPARIDETVRKVMNNKFIDGQLDECDLTLKDIERISVTFTRVLSAMYHTRVKYPEKKNGNGHRDKKPSENNRDQSRPYPHISQKSSAS